MPTPRPTVSAIAAAIQALEKASRKRALTDREADLLAELLFEQRRRLQRLPVQIAACEAKLLRLRAEQAVLS